MKKILLFALMGLVMMGSFTSCKKDKQEKEFKKNIVGKWKSYTSNGTLCLTNYKVVDDFFADGTGEYTNFGGKVWYASTDLTYKIVGDKFTKYYKDEELLTATITSITNTYLTFVDGSCPTVGTSFNEYIMERVTVDYKQAFVGLWEGVSMTGDETYGAEDHRWQFYADGTYVYLTKNIAGDWEADPSNTGNNYYVDGNFFGGRWFKDDVEYKEWWDIDYCNDTEMRWSALRQKEDGSLFTTTMTMKRVNE